MIVFFSILCHMPLNFISCSFLLDKCGVFLHSCFQTQWNTRHAHRNRWRVVVPSTNERLSFVKLVKMWSRTMKPSNNMPLLVPVLKRTNSSVRTWDPRCRLKHRLMPRRFNHRIPNRMRRRQATNPPWMGGGLLKYHEPLTCQNPWSNTTNTTTTTNDVRGRLRSDHPPQGLRFHNRLLNLLVRWIQVESLTKLRPRYIYLTHWHFSCSFLVG